MTYLLAFGVFLDLLSVSSFRINVLSPSLLSLSAQLFAILVKTSQLTESRSAALTALNDGLQKLKSFLPAEAQNYQVGRASPAGTYCLLYRVVRDWSVVRYIASSFA